SSAAHLLGFVGKDEEGGDLGYFGLEGYYNLALSGKPGFESLEKDAQGTPILLGDTSEILAINGVDLLTNIDKAVQRSLEKRLLEGMERYGASGGTAIVMNPTNGAILGMSSFPSYDPKNYFKFGDSFFKNPAVSDTFEPGSVFKVLIMAAALDAGAVEPDTVCEICAGPLKVDKYFIETWNKEYRPDSTMLDVIVHSDNVGMAFVGQKIGADTLYDYLDKFGIGSATGIDLQGESSPLLRERGTWNIVDLATASFGQGVAVTPIQMIKAVGIIANGGKVVKPQVVDKLLGEGWEEDIKPEIGERVISQETVAEITAMMVEAARNGEAKWTHLRGFSVAGKTGTAQIPIAGHYDDEKTIASFIGFAPAVNPKFIMLVTLKEPQTSPWASETAAPLWYSIARDLFPYFGIQPEN
ncbi:MAG: penicillin-binding protein 2, partial [Patescibacteria group bacterium]